MIVVRLARARSSCWARRCSPARPPLPRWFTPLMWTAYVLAADALVLRRRGRSLIHDRPREAAFLATVSIPLWLVFEVYNWRLRNWDYFGVPEPPWLAAVGYAWAFATIWPGLFETAALLGAYGPWESGVVASPARLPRGDRRPSPTLLRAAIAVGAVFVVVPLAPPGRRPALDLRVRLARLHPARRAAELPGRPAVVPRGVDARRPGSRLPVAPRRARLRAPLGILELLGGREVEVRRRAGLPRGQAVRDAARRLPRLPPLRARSVCDVSSRSAAGRAVRRSGPKPDMRRLLPSPPTRRKNLRSRHGGRGTLQ